MLALELCSYVSGVAGTGCSIYDDTALAVDLGIKPTIMKLLKLGFNKLMFYEEKVSSEGKIVIRAIPKRG